MRTTVPSTMPALSHGSLKDQADTTECKLKETQVWGPAQNSERFPRALETEVMGFQRPRAEQTPAVIPELVLLQGRALCPWDHPISALD